MQAYRLHTKGLRIFYLLVSGFCLYSAGMSFYMQRQEHGLMSLGVFFLLWGLMNLDGVLGLSLSEMSLATALLLAVAGPILGTVHRFYFTYLWWDSFIHGISGFLLVAVGFSLPESKLMRGKADWGFHQRMVLAFLFSMAAASFWELWEFMWDQLLGMDLQGDTLITGISSHLLGVGEGVGRIEDIRLVTIDKRPLPFEGYLDIGLIDTMMDTLSHLIGAVLFCALASSTRFKRLRWFTRLFINQGVMGD